MIDNITQNMWKTYTGTLVALALVLGLVSVYYFTEPNYHETVHVIDHVAENLNRSPIQDLVIVQGECPKGFELESLAEWPGTISGCDKRDTLLGSGIKSGSCGKKSSGKTIHSTPAVPLNSWKTHSICIKRYDQFSFVHGKPCPYEFQQCGAGLCIPSAADCPISEINEVEGEVLKFEVKREETSKYPIDITVTFGGVSCIDDKLNPLVNHTHILIDKHHIGCGIYGPDLESVVIHKATELEILKENNVDLTVPELKDSLIHNSAFLVVKHRHSLDWKSECHQDYSAHRTISDHLESAFDYFNYMLYVIGVTFIVQLVWLFCILSPSKKSKTPPPDFDKGVEFYRQSGIGMAISAAHCLIVIIFTTLAMTQWYYLPGHAEEFSLISKLRCFQIKSINDAFAEVNNELSTATFAIPIMCLGFAGSVIILQFVAYFDKILGFRTKVKLQ